MTNTVDTIVIGQGLAGTTLAWALTRSARSFVVVDAPDVPCASQVAAGLVTPVTGRALRARPDYPRQLELCSELYKWVEQRTASSLWLERAALRLFPTAGAARALASACARHPELIVTGGRLPPGLTPVAAVATMPSAARLDVAAYLSASRAAFARDDQLREARVAYDELRIDALGVHLDRLQLTAASLVWCGGASDADNGWLPPETLSPARGELIEVRLPGVSTAQVIHRGGRWLRPLAGDLYQFGATYDHSDPVPHTTAAARKRLLHELSEWIDGPVTCVRQLAGVRPVARDRQPWAAAHAVHGRVFTFNGLGSHGVLTAPGLAGDLVARLPAS